MKKSLKIAGFISALVLMSLCISSCSDNDDNSDSEKKYGSLYTVTDFKKCYADNTAKSEITFLLDRELWGDSVTDSLENAHVRGSFTTWTDEDDFKLTLDSSGKFYSVTVPYSKVTTLGNSGHPEYKFNITGTDDGYLNAFDKDFIPEPYCFHTSDNNLILIFKDENIEDIKACSTTAGTWKTTLADWNLDTADDKTKEKFANFRAVPGTKNVYRSWHPFKVKYHKDGSSKFLYETEPERVKMVTSLYEKYKIKTDICLSGDETKSLSTYTVKDGNEYTETVPDYYKTLMDAGDVCNVSYTPKGSSNPKTPEYKYIYQSSYNEEYLNGWLQNIIDFVKDDAHKGPYNIHCRLGNDRTGYYCAVVAGLCGATWNEIAADYQTSNNTYLGEYRDQRLLKQVFEKQFNKGNDISTVSNLKECMYAYYTTNDKLTIQKEDLDALVAKFSAN